ncbi:condensation domain-containing protein [Caballeronia grimmiae]|nr:condensation domain-containing protein [Caballeronia grimmiae]
MSRTQARAATPTTAFRNLCAVFRLSGAPDSERLGRAVAHVARHCKPLRWRVIRGDDGPRYLLHDAALASLEVVDLDDTDEARNTTAIETLCARPLRIDAGAPWSITLLRGAANGYLVFACHPALLDRFSLQPLFASLSRAYAGETFADDLALDQEGILEAERVSMEPQQWQSDLAFWVRQLADGEFAWQPPRVEGAPGESGFAMPLGGALSRALREQAHALGLSVEFLLQSCLHVVLQKMSRQSSVITAHHRRGSEQSYDRAGHDERVRFICSEFDETMTLRQFLQHAAVRFAMADFHSNIPPAMSSTNSSVCGRTTVARPPCCASATTYRTMRSFSATFAANCLRASAGVPSARTSRSTCARAETSRSMCRSVIRKARVDWPSRWNTMRRFCRGSTRNSTHRLPGWISIPHRSRRAVARGRTAARLRRRRAMCSLASTISCAPSPMRPR